MTELRNSSAEASQPRANQQLRTLQIIVGAIASGALFFMLVVIAIAGSPSKAAQPMVAYVGLAFAAAVLLGRFFFTLLSDRQAVKTACDAEIPARVRAHQRDLARLAVDGQPTDDAMLLWPRFLTRVMVSVAMIEGAVFLNLIAYMIEHQLFSLIVAAVLLVYILLHFPTNSAFINWARNIVDQAARRGTPS
ncbi:MAG: hypothetical protein U0795_16405 [Pirellulales bacterium]